MSTLVEIVGPASATGKFGADGLYTNNPGDVVRVVCDDPADTNLVSIGPVIVSWNGRLATTHVFVHPGVDPGTTDWTSLDSAFIVPLRILVAGKLSNREFFYIVRPQPAIIATGGGVLGSGSLGQRSRRGAMIVDSVALGPGIWTVGTADNDALTPGNQGYLPFVLISRGPVSGATGATISANANGKHGGPGGGGGGGSFCDVTGNGSDGGNGYSGGGRGGRNGSSVSSDEFRAPGTGTGPGLANTGGSLNGVEGGSAPWFEASGGGTGHPFGRSGQGCDNGPGCTPAGGFGGGSGQQQTVGGGAGGYGTAGQSTNAGNGGQVNGNRQIVPLAGGSGGASGNPQGLAVCSGEGGGGGGAIRIAAPEILSLTITANGADGQDRANGPGGAGSGGAISIESKMAFSTSQASVAGGQRVAVGGAGRFRIDGPRNSVSLLPATASNYRGPSTDTSSLVGRSFMLTGTGSGDYIHVFLKSVHMPWRRIDTVKSFVGNYWTENIALPGNDDVYYLVAVQEQMLKDTGSFTRTPAMVMSQAAWNVLRVLTVPYISAPTARVVRLVCDDERIDTLTVRNSGEAPLSLDNPRFVSGTQGFSLVSPTAFPVSVPPLDSVRFILRYRATGGVTGIARDTLIVETNDTTLTYRPWRLALEAQKDSAQLLLSAARIDFGTRYFCSGRGTDTVITITNTGTVPMRVLTPTGLGTDFTVTDPPPAAFPITVAPGAPVQLRVHFDPATPGAPSTATLHLDADAEGCVRTFDVPLSGTAHLVALTWIDAIDFGALACPGDYRDTTITITNIGSVDVTLFPPSPQVTAYSVSTPSLPLTVPTGASRTFTIRYAPAQAGVHAGALVFPDLPCGSTRTIAVTGRRDSLALTTASLDFGVLRASQFPVQRPMTVHNTGSVPAVLAQASFTSGTPFTVVSGVPVSIAPGDSAVLMVQFSDPATDGIATDQLTLQYTPACAPTVVTVRGQRATASVVLAFDTLRAAPGEAVGVSVYLRSSVNPQLFGATGIQVTMRYRKSLLEPRFSFTGSVQGSDRLVDLTLPFSAAQNGVLTTLPFRAMLGDTVATILGLENAQSIGGQLDIKTVPGLFSLRVCTEGGNRLFTTSGTAGIKAVRPNPFNPAAEITYTLIEEGPTRLLVLDMLGRTVAVLADGAAHAGEWTARFNAAMLPSGVYTCVLVTPTAAYSKGMMLVK